MSEVKPTIAELYESGGLDMWLVNKIAHNELDKRKGDTRSSVYALASENIDCYTDSRCSEIIENYAAVLDSQLTAEDYGGARFLLSSYSVLLSLLVRNLKLELILNISIRSSSLEPLLSFLISACLNCNRAVVMRTNMRLPESIPIASSPSVSSPFKM